MKLGFFTAIYNDLSLERVIEKAKFLGVQMLEIGCGGYPGNSHCNPELLLRDESALALFKQKISDAGLEVSALSCHGNPVHPDKESAKNHDEIFRNTILLAERLGIKQINTFSGCPGGSKDDVTPNWVTCAWPDDFQDVLEYQWNGVLIPYWKDAAKFAMDHGVDKIALEMHPGFSVYNPYTLLKLREAVGSTIGANFDPSHLFWQGIDPSEAILELGDSIFHVHAKDVGIIKHQSEVHGNLDTRKYHLLKERSWYFRTVGYGHDDLAWKTLLSSLRSVGYDYAISIEHEDPLMSLDEGLKKAVYFLQPIIFNDSIDSVFNGFSE